MKSWITASVVLHFVCDLFEYSRGIDVPPNRVSAIVNAKRSITADTALRLGKYFNVSPEIWLGLQTDYEMRVAQRNIWPEIEGRIRAHAA